MAKINLEQCYSIVDDILKEHQIESGIAQLTDGVVRSVLVNYFTVSQSEADLVKKEENEKLSVIYDECGVVSDEIKDKLYTSIEEVILDKIRRQYPRDYQAPYLYRNGELTIPFHEVGPGQELLGRIKLSVTVNISRYENIIKSVLGGYRRFNNDSFSDIGRSYFGYCVRDYFAGFSRQEIEHPLAPYFDKGELVDILMTNSYDDLSEKEYNETKAELLSLDLVDLILDVFSELEAKMSFLTNLVIESIGVSEYSVVYIYRTHNVNRVRIYVDRETLQERVFNAAFDMNTCGIKSDASERDYRFCKCNL